MSEFDEWIAKLEKQPPKEAIEKLRRLLAKLKEQDRQWFHVTFEAIWNHTARHQSREFTRQRLLKEDYERICEKTGTRGKTPGQTLSYYLQELEKAGIIDFLDTQGRPVPRRLGRGRYRLRD